MIAHRSEVGDGNNMTKRQGNFWPGSDVFTLHAHTAMMHPCSCPWSCLMRRHYVVSLILLLASELAAAQALPAATPADCSRARDPVRCEAHQAALAACAHERGKRKTACLSDRMPPIDCSKAANPSRCENIERAKQTCADKRGKAQQACLKGEIQRSKVKKANKAKKKKATKKPPRQPDGA